MVNVADVADEVADMAKRMWDDDDEYGERRGVKGTGPYARRRR